MLAWRDVGGSAWLLATAPRCDDEAVCALAARSDDGAFTYARLQGLRNGTADADHNQSITVGEPQTYVVQRERHLTTDLSMYSRAYSSALRW